MISDLEKNLMKLLEHMNQSFEELSPRHYEGELGRKRSSKVI